MLHYTLSWLARLSRPCIHMRYQELATSPLHQHRHPMHGGMPVSHMRGPQCRGACTEDLCTARSSSQAAIPSVRVDAQQHLRPVSPRGAAPVAFQPDSVHQPCQLALTSCR